MTTAEYDAARTIARQKHIPLRTNDPQSPGRYELLEMLDLIEEAPDGTMRVREPIEADETPRAPMTEVHGTVKTRTIAPPSADKLLKDRSLLPPGLRNISDVEAKKK